MTAPPRNTRDLLARAGLPDPQRGEVWEHVDGGSLYVRERSGPLVHVQRRPFGDSQAMPRWIRLKTFGKQAIRRLNERWPLAQREKTR